MKTNINVDAMDFSKARILVVGDVMLDQYWYGNTERISPEAPVPIVRVDSNDLRLGGAANVAWNLQVLGCQVKLLSIVGDDAPAISIKELLDDKGIAHNIVSDNSFVTIRKLRVISRQQQMLRVDHEDQVASLSMQAKQELIKIFQHEIQNFDLVILSDYAKGILENPAPYIDVAKQTNVPVFADPKTLDFSKYQGVTVLKPNLQEFTRVVGECCDLTELEKKSHSLIKSCDINNIIVTRGHAGVSIVARGQKALHYPAYGGEVYDVTGAGDTVIASLAAATCAGLDLSLAVRFSTAAAAVVVGKVGTSTANVAEIKSLLNKRFHLPLGIVEERLLQDVVKLSQARGEKVVLVNGCYDILHYGHVRYLQKASELGDRLIVAVNSDSSIKRLKGETRPIYSEVQRMEVLASLQMVDWVVLFNEDTPGRIVSALSPDVLVKGSEHFADVASIPSTEGVSHVLSKGGQVHLIERTPDISSSAAIEHLEV